MPTTPTSPTSGVNPTTLLGRLPTPAKPASAFDKDMFMKLLVAQMKNQNPLNPSDGSEYLQQAAQLAMVENMTAMTTSQTEATGWQRSLAAAAMVGKTVTGADAGGSPVTGVVDRIGLGGGRVTLTIGGKSVDFSTVTSVSAK